MLRPRERRRPQMPNQLSAMVEQRIVAFALGNPGLGPRRVSAQLARGEWGGLLVSPNGVSKTLVRHGLNTRAKRLALVAGYRAPYEPPADHRDRYLQLLRVRRPRRVPAGRADRRAHLAAGAPRRLRPPARRLATRARAQRQRQRVRPPRIRSAPTRRRRAQPDPLRAPADQRPRRTTEAHDPRRMLAPSLRALPASPLQRPTPPPRALPAHLQPPPRPHRTHHRRTVPRRPRLRCPQTEPK